MGVELMVTIHERDTMQAMVADYFREMPRPVDSSNFGFQPGTGIGMEWVFAPPYDGVARSESGAVLDEMLTLDLDSRYAYLAANGFGPDDLDAVARLSGEWINSLARSRLRELAAECVAVGNDVTRLLETWLYDVGTLPMRWLLPHYVFPDRGLAVCFVLCNAYQLAYAAHRVAEIDRRRSMEPPIDWSQFADPERVAEDVRLAEAGFEEEVAQWPEY